MPLGVLREQWRASAIRRFGVALIDGLLERARAAAAVIRARVQSVVDVALAAIDVTAVVLVMRGSFSRRHLLAEARRHLGETLRGRRHEPGLDDWIVDVALRRHCRQQTRPQPGRRTPATDMLFHTATWHRPPQRWIAAPGGTARAATPYERAQIASNVLRQHIQAAGSPNRLSRARSAASDPTTGQTTDPATWNLSPERLARLAAYQQQAKKRVRQMRDQPDVQALAPSRSGDQRAHQQQNPAQSPRYGRH